MNFDSGIYSSPGCINCNIFDGYFCGGIRFGRPRGSFGVVSVNSKTDSGEYGEASIMKRRAKTEKERRSDGAF